MLPARLVISCYVASIATLSCCRNEAHYNIWRMMLLLRLHCVLRKQTSTAGADAAPARAHQISASSIDGALEAAAAEYAGVAVVPALCPLPGSPTSSAGGGGSSASDAVERGGGGGHDGRPEGGKKASARLLIATLCLGAGRATLGRSRCSAA
jgi:hypothetical protein